MSSVQSQAPGLSSSNGYIGPKIREGWFDLTPPQLLENMTQSLCPVDVGLSKEST